MLHDNIDDITRFVYNQRELAVHERTVNFWTQYLARAPATLVHDTNGKDQVNMINMHASMDLPVLKTFCRHRGVTLQSLGLLAWSLTLASLTGQSDVIFGILLSGRTSEETKNLHFPTFNTCIFRSRLHNEKSRTEMLQTTHQLAIGVSEHQQMSTSEALKLIRSGNLTGFNTLFNYQRLPSASQGNDSILVPCQNGHATSSPPYAFNIELEESDDKLLLTLATQAGVTSSRLASSMLETMDSLLTQLISSQDSSIASILSSCGNAFRERQVVDANQAAKLLDPPTQLQQSSYEESSSVIESEIRCALAKASGMVASEIDRDMSLFQMGLDSISTITVSRILKDASITIPVSVIIKQQSVRNIANYYEGINRPDIAQANPSRSEIDTEMLEQLEQAGVKPGDLETVSEASAGQIFVLDNWIAGGKRTFYATFWLKITNTTLQTIQHAMNILLSRHSSLRTRFMMYENQTWQIVLKAGLHHRYALSYRMLEQDGDTILALHLHHALYDAISLDLLIQELRMLCRRDVMTTTSMQQQRMTTSLGATEQRYASTFWQNYIAGVTKVHVGKTATFRAERSGVFEAKLSPTYQLQDLCRKQGISIQALLFALVGRTYARQRDMNEEFVIVGIYLANRSLDINGISESTDPTFNVVPLKINVSLDMTVLDSAEAIQEDLKQIGESPYCLTSLRQIWQWTGLKLDCYVNFIKMPEDVVETWSHSHVQITHATLTKQQEAFAKEVVDDEVSPYINEEGLGEEAAWCVPSLDVELKVNTDDTLALGLFAPNDLLDSGQLDAMRLSIRQDLEEICKQIPNKLSHR